MPGTLIQEHTKCLLLWLAAKDVPKVRLNYSPLLRDWIFMRRGTLPIRGKFVPFP